MFREAPRKSYFDVAPRIYDDVSFSLIDSKAHQYFYLNRYHRVWTKALLIEIVKKGITVSRGISMSSIIAAVKEQVSCDLAGEGAILDLKSGQ